MHGACLQCTARYTCPEYRVPLPLPMTLIYLLFTNEPVTLTTLFLLNPKTFDISPEESSLPSLRRLYIFVSSCVIMRFVVVTGKEITIEFSYTSKIGLSVLSL